MTGELSPLSGTYVASVSKARMIIVFLSLALFRWVNRWIEYTLEDWYAWRILIPTRWPTSRRCRVVSTYLLPQTQRGVGEWMTIRASCFEYNEEWGSGVGELGEWMTIACVSIEICRRPSCYITCFACTQKRTQSRLLLLTFYSYHVQNKTMQHHKLRINLESAVYRLKCLLVTFVT